MYIKKLIFMFIILIIPNIFLTQNVVSSDYKIQFGELIPLEKYANKKFSVHSGYYTICEEDKSVIQILITNLGNTYSKYTLNSKGGSWGKLPKTVTIAPKKSNLLFFALYPTKDSEGTYIFDIYVKDNKGTVKKQLPVLVEKCYSVKIQVDSKKENACECTPYSQEFIIGNYGKFSADINLILESPEWLVIHPRKVSLGGNTKETISVSGNVPCNISGIYPVIINTENSEDRFYQRLNYSLEILNKDCEDKSFFPKRIISIDNRYIFDKNIVTKIKNSVRNVEYMFYFYKSYLLSGTIIGFILIIWGNILLKKSKEGYKK